MYDVVRHSYDRIAERYAEEIGAELAGKPLDRALLACLVDVARDAAAQSADAAAPTVGDLGCGPGHVAAYLADLGATPVGIDLSPGMLEVGARRHPAVQFREGSLLALPATDGELAGAIALYSIIHLRAEDRPVCYREMARVIRPGGWLLIAFHVGLVGQPDGGVIHADQWWGQSVDLDFHYLDPAGVTAELAAAGFAVVARTDREPWPAIEHESRRCYLLCRRP